MAKCYCLIINKKHNHRPETIAAIDFSKAVVADLWEHKGLGKSEFGSNMFNFSTNPLTFIQPSIEIGAALDKNSPAQSMVSKTGNPGIIMWDSYTITVPIIWESSTMVRFLWP